ncbi:MAG: efflux RND transporter periplasmic adaptor subunit [Anaerolineales bacterium]|nr:efflux RND transporter periplasmic adaptor subunit [Anaerolineales bacterium]
MNAKTWLSKIPGRAWAGIVLIVIAITVISGYSVYASQKEAASEESSLQTATVTRGEMTLSASGTGVLSIGDEEELAFTVAGTVLGVYIQPGDTVRVGDLLAEVDPTEAQADYETAKRTYMELTSPAAIASALDALARAQKDYSDTRHVLEYLVSPDVLYWEEKIAEAQKALETAQAQLNANPDDTQAKREVETTTAYLQDAAVSLNEARNDYYNEYVFENFVKRTKDGSYLTIPTKEDIQIARLAIDDAQVALEDAKTVYDAMVSGEIPEGTGIPSLLEIQAAKRALDDAQEKLEGTKILAPINGTVLTVDIAVGDETDTVTVMSVADISHAYLELYMDESDWDKTVTGHPVEVTFDALPDTVFTGTISSVDSELYTSGTSTAVHGTADLDSSISEINLPIGASASVEVISLEAKNILLVPLEALHQTDNGYAVFLVTESGMTFQYIEIGAQNELYAEVKTGLIEGDTVALGIDIEK